MAPVWSHLAVKQLLKTCGLRNCFRAPIATLTASEIFFNATVHTASTRVGNEVTQ